MAKPRIFVSSTYYDLRHIRKSLETFIDGFGYEPVLFESGDIPFKHDIPLDESCYEEIPKCNMLILIIGGRAGSAASESEELTDEEIKEGYKRYNSVTKREYEQANEIDIPIFIFVDKNVLAEYQTYKRNRDNESIKYVHVDSTNVFMLLDDIVSQKRNNFIKEFEKFDDISFWLKEQWAGLFSDFLTKSGTESTLKGLSYQIDELRSITGALHEYTMSIMRQIKPKESEEIISRAEKRILSDTIKRFSSEPLVNYLSGRYEIDAGKIYSALKGAKSLNQFLGMVGIDRTAIKEFIDDVGVEATRDFKEMKDKYFFKDNE